MSLCQIISSVIVSQLLLANLGSTYPQSEPDAGSRKFIEGPKVIIVGAGISGVAAASKLMQNGITDITILEAMDRIGGRINYHKIGDSGVDLGAHWVHGKDNNSLYEIAEPLNLLNETDDFDNMLYLRPDGSKLDLSVICNDLYTEIMGNISSYNESLRSLSYKELINQRMEEFGRTNGLSKSDLEGLKIYMINNLAILESSANLDDVSLNVLEENEKPEDFIEWKAGDMTSAVKLLMGTHEKSPWFGLGVDKKVKLSSRVSEIKWGSGDGVTATLENGDVITADFLVFTPSLNVLKKKHKALFSPPLPQDKVEVIEALGMDVVDKVYLYYNEPWWPIGFHGFILLPEREYNPETKNWGDAIVEFTLENHNPHVVCAWLVGDAAKAMEAASDEEVTATVFQVLKRFAGKLYDVKQPDLMTRSSWWSNADIMGSYSYTTLAADKLHHPRETLAQPLITNNGKMVIMFAGEATNEDNHGTVHGALETGWREADRLIQYTKHNR